MSIKESQIQTAIEHVLSMYRNQGLLVYIKNNSGAMHVGRRFVRFGLAGSSDFLIFLRDGMTIHCEVKNEKGRQSKNQKQYQSDVESLGHMYCIVRSVEDVETVLKPYIS